MINEFKNESRPRIRQRRTRGIRAGTLIAKVFGSAERTFIRPSSPKQASGYSAGRNKIIVVTGGTGSIGSELVRQLLIFNPKQIRVLSRNDTRQYNLAESLGFPDNVRFLIGDVRDRARLDLAFESADIIFHAAALKHVPLCEYNPIETVKTNVIGSQNVIEAAIANKVKKVIAISTDKAVDPDNVMGVSKLMMEKLFINTNSFAPGGTKLSCVRFGNVAWAGGSVLPLWKKQAETTGQIRVTNKSMTRFMMSISQAVQLTLRAAELAQGGEIFVFRMPATKLGDLAKLFLVKYFPASKVKIVESARRAGEKMIEELFSVNDHTKQILTDGKIFILIPQLYMFNLKQDMLRYPGFKNVHSLKRFSSVNSINNRRIKEII